jgi:hypothetical protein
VDQTRLQTLAAQLRKISVAESGDPDLGPLKLLPGTWVGKGKGFNMIALPYDSNDLSQYRLLVNQYDEHLTFDLVDKAVPNRGLDDTEQEQNDQLIVALNYEQVINQVAAADYPESGLAGPAGKAIHHEVGLFLHLLNEVTDGLNLARLATIPHGDTVNVLGFSRELENEFPQPAGFRGLPLGVDAREDGIDHFYFEPYKHFHENPFMGFDPVNPLELLTNSLPSLAPKSTVLVFGTSDRRGTVENIPFIVRHNNAVSMTSVFWIHQYDDGRLILQYQQVVMMEFFGRRDRLPGRIQWPHVSINTLEKVSDTPLSYRELGRTDAKGPQPHSD